MDRMNGNNSYDQRIILKYEQYLSPYGRKVLSALVNLKKERKTNNFKPTLYPSTSQLQSPYQNKKVINFNKEKDTPKVHSTLNYLASEKSDSDTTSHFNFQNQSSTNTQSVVTSSNNLLKVPFNDILCVTTENVCYTNDPNNNDANIILNNINATNKENETSDDISWDDMFDTDMLRIDNEVNSEISKIKQDKPVALEIVDKNKTSKPENKRIREIDTEIDKRIANNSNTNVKKAKTVIVSKNKEKVSIRKEKYTTTVKNWLNDNIGTANISHKEYVNDDQHDQETGNLLKIIGAEKQKNIELEIGKPVNKKNRNKRTVQAQLANKDGVMKYKKPKIAAEEQTNTALIITTSADNNEPISKVKNPNVSVKTKPIKEAKIIKENKVKPKFVVPIKSQLPVKDVSYNVVIINDLINIGAVLNDLEKIALNEGVMTLVYSNGFNQLNRQHTDDTCTPEGVMFCFQDTFYYIEGLVHGIKDGLCRILSSNSIISFDAKSILVYLMCQYDLMPHGFNIIDAKIGSSLINPDEPPENFSEMQKLLGYNAEYTIATDCTLQKAAWYMTLLRECSSNLKCLLVEQGLWKVFDDIEMKILPIVAEMEFRGISVDITKLKEMEGLLLARIKEIERQCYAAAGKVFQINSTVQVRALIYDELKLDTTSNVKIRETICKGAKSTSEAMLRSLITVHPLPKLILEYRHLHKAHATFLAGIAQHVCDGVVKPTWDQTAAATGRIASNNPNLQAIPKMPFNLVLFPNDDDNDKQSLNFRSVYVARAGHTLLAADFKHIECRVFAHAAADSGLLSALESPDLFRVLAAKWLNKSESDVSAEDRERTKRIVYASLYGAGTRKLADILDLGYEQVLSIMTSFNRTFPSLKSFGRSVVTQCCRQQGRLSTASGRARAFPNITSSDFHAKSHAERQAVNFIIQGSAADLCKMAMVVSTERLLRRAQAHLLLQIHDELVWEVLDQHLHLAAGIIKSAMEGCGQTFGMPQTLPVAMYRGSNWGEMEEFTPT